MNNSPSKIPCEDYFNLAGIYWEWFAMGSPIYSYRFFLYRHLDSSYPEVYIINFTVNRDEDDLETWFDGEDYDDSSEDIPTFNIFNFSPLRVDDDFDTRNYIRNQYDNFIPDSLENFQDLQGGDKFLIESKYLKEYWLKIKNMALSLGSDDNSDNNRVPVRIDNSRCANNYELPLEKIKELCAHEHLHYIDRNEFFDYGPRIIELLCSKNLCVKEKCSRVKTPKSKYCCCHYLENKAKKDRYHCYYCGEIPYCYKVFWLLKRRKRIIPDIYRLLLTYVNEAYHNYYLFKESYTRCENCIDKTMNLRENHIHWPPIIMKSMESDDFYNVWNRHFGKREEITLQEAKSIFPTVDIYFADTIKRCECLFACTGITNRQFRLLHMK